MSTRLYLDIRTLMRAKKIDIQHTKKQQLEFVEKLDQEFVRLKKVNYKINVCGDIFVGIRKQKKTTLK